MTLPVRNLLDIQQTWESFRAWLLAEYDHIALLPSANNARGAWATATTYNVNDYVVSAGATYVCMLGHISGVFATDLSAAKWGLFDNTALRADLAAASGSSTIGFQSSGTGAVAGTAQTKLRKFVTDGDHSTEAQSIAEGNAKPVKIYNTLTVVRNSVIEGYTVSGNMSGVDIFMRAYTDLTNFNATGTTGAYTSYDTLAKIGNGTTDPHYNHSFGYEARHTFQGNNGIDNFWGFYSSMTVNGLAGTSSSGKAVTNCFGFMHENAQGTGTIASQAAFYCNDLTRGTNNYAAYFGVVAGTNKYNVYAVGTAENLFNGLVTANGGMKFAASTVMQCLGSITWNLPGSSYLQFNGVGTVAQLQSVNAAGNAFQPLALNASVVATNCPVRTQTYTVATLPAANSMGAGSRAFVTDATATTFASIPVGGGSNGVPVYCDNTPAWRIG